MTEVDEQTKFTFDQLSDTAKARARRNHTDGDYPWHEWWDLTFDGFIEIAEILGFTVDTKGIHFSGFCSQGDGASFSGYYACPGACSAAINEHAPEDEVLRGLAEELDALQVGAQLAYNTTWSCQITKSGRYSHSGGMSITGAEIDFPQDSDDIEVTFQQLAQDGAEKVMLAVAQGLADWLYRRLNDEYDYLCSDEYVDEHLKDSGDLFDEDGDTI